MAVSYKKLLILMVELDLQLQDIQKNTKISWVTISKIKKGDYITLSYLEKICRYLSEVTNKKIDIGDIVEIIV